MIFLSISLSLANFTHHLSISTFFLPTYLPLPFFPSISLSLYLLLPLLLPYDPVLSRFVCQRENNKVELRPRADKAFERGGGGGGGGMSSFVASSNLPPPPPPLPWPPPSSSPSSFFLLPLLLSLPPPSPPSSSSSSPLSSFTSFFLFLPFFFFVLVTHYLLRFHLSIIIFCT